MPLLTTITARILAEVQNTINQGTQRASVKLDASVTMQDGTGSKQAQKAYSATRTLASGANETLDFNGGGLLDPAGNALNLTNIKAILIKAADGNSTDLTVGAATNPFLGPLGGTTPTVTLKPGASYMVTNPINGWTVANASNDGIRVANAAGASATYDIQVIGY